MARRTTSAPRSEQDKSVWSYLVAGISGGLLLVIVGIAVAVILVPWITNSTALTVLTRSMEPSYPPGTLVIVQPVKPNEVGIGDVITYQLAPGVPEYVTHRVIAVSQTTGGDYLFSTKGDNNGLADSEQIVSERVMGRVWYSLPWIGWVNNAVGGGGKTWLVIGLAVLLFAYAGWQFIGALFNRGKKKDEPAPAAANDTPTSTGTPVG